MKDKLLYLAIGMILVMIIPHHFRLIAMIAFIVYWTNRFQDRSFLYLILFFFILLIPRKVDLPLESGLAKVVSIRKNYTVLMIDHQRYICYDLDDIEYDDVIAYTAKFSYLNSDLSNHGFDYQKWALGKDIKAEIKISDYSIIKEGHSIRTNLFKKINLIEDEELKTFVLKLLFQYTTDDSLIDNDIVGFLSSTQTHLSSSLFIFEKIVSLFLYPLFTSICSCFLLVGLAFYFEFSFVIYQLLLQRILLVIKNKYDRLGLLIIILLLINPYYIYNIRFQLVMLIRFIGLFKKDQRFYDHPLIVMFVQLLNFYKANIVSTFLFGYLRYYILLMYWLAIISASINEYQLVNTLYLLLKRYIISIDFYISGKPSILIVTIYLIYLIKYFKKRRFQTFMLLMMILIINQYQLLFYPYGEVTFINVGQGDSSLIRLPFSKDIVLIDTGSAYNQRKLQSYLDALGAKTIEAILITHDDSDHSGNLAWLVNNYHVKHVYDQKLSELRIKGLSFTGLLSENTYDDKNDNSQIWLTSINELTYLFLGDISAEVERELIDQYPNLQVDLLKIAHHGSKSSTSDYLLRSLNPYLSIISVGKDNIYHHPSYEVLKRLEAYRIPYLQTATSGDISIYFGYFFNLVHTSNHEFVIINKVIK